MQLSSLNDLTRRRGFVPAALFSLAQWGLATLPAGSLQSIQAAPHSALLRLLLSDPSMHVLTFALLALLIAWGFGLPAQGPARLAKIGLLAAGVGLVIEVYQGLLPWRSFGLDDLLWNTVGVLCALALLAWPWRWKSSRGKVGGRAP